MKPQTQISWLDLILLVLLTATGMGLWLFTDDRVNLYMKYLEPRGDEIQIHYKVQSLQFEVTQERDSISNYRNQLAQKRIDLARYTAEQDQLEQAYSNINALSTQLPPTAAMDTIRSYIQIHEDLEATTRLVTALQSELNAITENNVDLSRQLDIMPPNTRDYAINESKLSSLKSQIESVRRNLIAAQDHQAVQRAKIDAMQSNYPQLSNMSTGTIRLYPISSDILQSYLYAPVQRQETERIIAQLQTAITTTESLANDRALALAEAQRSADTDFVLALDAFGWQKKWVVLILSVSGFSATVLALHVVDLLVIKTNKIRINRMFILLGAVSMLGVLFAFEVGQALGAALVSILILSLFVRSRSLPVADLTTRSREMS
jgi:hypothetical protein